MTDPGIREAVRQLGRAVGTLVRAVVGAVGRKHPAAAARDQSGPPQEWLDLVAETDPEWLARSEWADRAPRPRRKARRSDVPGETPRLIEPEWESGDESSQQPEASVLRWPAVQRSVPRSADVEQEEPPVVTPRRAERPVRRLQPVAQADDAAAIDDPAPPVRRRREPAPATAPDRPLDEGGVPAPEVPARPLRVAEPIAPDEPTRHVTEVPAVAATPPTRRSSESLRPVRDLATYEPVRTVAERSRLASVHLLPPDRATESRPATLDGEAPDRPQTAEPSRWPELPRTDSLDEDPTPGLASRLWLADDRADSLTTAQRRS